MDPQKDSLGRGRWSSLSHGGDFWRTTVLDQFERFNRRLSSVFEWVGVIGLLMMMAITCIDVVGAKVFLWRLLGAIDIVMLSQIVAISFAASMTLILGRHIQVEFLMTKLPRRVQGAIQSLISLLGLGLFILIAWRLYMIGDSFKTSGEHSATANIPYYPFAYGIALASIPVCFTLLIDFLKSIRKVVRG